MNSKLISTIAGIALAIISIISAVGLITQEQATTLIEWVPVVLEAIGAIIAIFTDGRVATTNVY